MGFYAILASASPRRKEILSRTPWEFAVKIPEVVEIDFGDSPATVALENAVRKADCVAHSCPCELVIGADTVVACEDKILGKPRDLAEARAMLNFLSGKTHCVISGVALRGAVSKEWTATSYVTFKSLSESDIEQYLAQVEVLDKAGAYAIQEHGELIVAKYDGELDNIVGLPTERLFAELEELSLTYDTAKINYGRRIWTLFWEYAKISTIIIGGGYALIPAAEKEFCCRRRWVSEEDMVKMIVVTQSVPGILAGNSALYIGNRIAGLGGALAALFGAVLPSLVILSVVAGFMKEIEITDPNIRGMFAGVIAAVTGMVAITAYKFAQKSLRNAFDFLIVCGVFVGMIYFGINPGWLIISAVISGIILTKAGRFGTQKKRGNPGGGK